MIIRAKTLKRWLKSNYDKSTLKDLCNHGAASGFPGLTYYSDTCKLYEKFKSEIWEMIVNQAEDFGYKNAFEFLATLRGQVYDDTTFENLMVWFAAEEYARQMTEEEEE